MLCLNAGSVAKLLVGGSEFQTDNFIGKKLAIRSGGGRGAWGPANAPGGTFQGGGNLRGENMEF